ncbi:putative acetyltransferase, GNAT superfamily [Methanocella conradii HZ254]|uniref:Acetyltransferase, GNAT superfamily n=1 Tax=Methanocella conradii (strain DSM 24694 / JCM 17849 / CGMCC 1.5162 / HZ254) TaxID=1041930 RepID=H8I6Z4_METCZ|nr:putative acetyltransferase, GNAT superfamily [Methanocella conradii HZ254]
MLVRNAFPGDFLEVAKKSKEWADLVIERETIYHIMTEHFRDTCFIAEERGEMIGYLLGFRSQARPEEALIHLIQVAPHMRGNGIGRRLFNQFQYTVKKMGCKRIVAITKPENNYCNRFHKAMGFNVVEAGEAIEVNGVRAIKDYNGPGKHMVLWHKNI